MIKFSKKISGKFIGIVKNARDSFLLKRISSGRYNSQKEELVYYSQFASPELVSDILDKKMLAQNDPKWRDFRFDTADEYAFWSWRACGIICLKMILDTLNKQARKTVAELSREAIELGGYEAYDKDGKLVDRGWFYKPLVALANKYGIKGKTTSNLSNSTICKEILNGRLVVASVDPCVIRSDYDVKRSSESGGHLVLVHGIEWKNGKCDGFYIHNPSGRTKEAQANAFIPIGRFEEAFAGRGMIFWK